MVPAKGRQGPSAIRPAPAPRPAMTSSRSGVWGGSSSFGSGKGPQQQPQLPPDDWEQVVPFTQYDAEINALYWETRPVPVVARLIRIGVEFGVWAAKVQLRALRMRGGGPARAEAREAAAADSLKDVLVRLGPAFVKIGQALSSRPDVMPPLYISALELLQDKIPAFPDEQAMAVLEAELGQPVSAVFSSISETTVAAASLGQVYRARLRGPGPDAGADVAVKVQRPAVAATIAMDVYILRQLAGWARAARKLNTDLPALVDEWATSLFKELDYRMEAANAEKFKALFSHLPQVVVPHIYNDYTTAKILTMEWIDGERLRTAGTSTSSAEGAVRGGGSGPVRGVKGRVDDLELVEVGVRCSLEQMLEEGFYHADPHPGNLLRTPDGRLAYLDFGMMGSIDAKTRTALMTATLHLVNREYGRLAEDFVALGLLPAGSARQQEIVPALTGVFSEALAGGVSNLSFGVLSGRLGATMYRFSFRIPPYYTLLVRSLSVLEGIALASNPDYKVLGAAYPWIARRLLTDPTPELRAALRRLLYTDPNAEGTVTAEPAGDGAQASAPPSVPTPAAASTSGAAGSGAAGGDDELVFRFDRLESLLRQAAKARSRIKRPDLPGEGGADGTTTAATATVRPAGSGASSSSSAVALLLSNDGEFVRDILLDELVKGIDAAWRLAADAGVSAIRSNVPPGVPAPAPLLLLLPGGPLLLGGLMEAAAGMAGAPWAGRGLGLGLNVGQQAGADARQANGNGSGASSGDLASALRALPSLARASDRAQLDGLQRLSNTLLDIAASNSAQQTQQQAAEGAPLGGVLEGILPPPGDAAAADAVRQAAAALQWLAREAAELPPDARLELLQLPLQIGSRLTSRLTARTIRSIAAANMAARQAS